MRPFAYTRADDVSSAVRLGAPPSPRSIAPTAAPDQFIAGGTLILDLMKLDTMRPEQLVDINGLSATLGAIQPGPQGLRLGALVRMSQLADDPLVNRDYPVIAQTMQLAAAAQLRNMASLGGNVLQRTRCQYSRAELEGVQQARSRIGLRGARWRQPQACGAGRVGQVYRRIPRRLRAGAGRAGCQRRDARARRSPHCPVREAPSRARNAGCGTVLNPGELITGFVVPAGPWTRRSAYFKVRDRQSYAFALASAAVALDMDGNTVREARIGLGGVAYRPWRAHEAEAALRGKRLDEASAAAAARATFAGAKPHEHNRYKVDLGQRTLVRALMQVGRMEMPA